MGLIGYILIFHECRIIQRNHFSLHQKYLCCLEYFQQGNGLLGMPFGGFLLNYWTPNVMLKIFSILKNLQILGLSFFNMFTVLLAFDGKNYLFIYSPVPNNRGGPTDNLNINKRGVQIKRVGGGQGEVGGCLKIVLGQKWQPVTTNYGDRVG